MNSDQQTDSAGNPIWQRPHRPPMMIDKDGNVTPVPKTFREEAIGDILAKCWDACAEIIPETWSGEP